MNSTPSARFCHLRLTYLRRTFKVDYSLPAQIASVNSPKSFTSRSPVCVERSRSIIFHQLRSPQATHLNTLLSAHQSFENDQDHFTFIPFIFAKRSRLSSTISSNLLIIHVYTARFYSTYFLTKIIRQLKSSLLNPHISQCLRPHPLYPLPSSI